MEKNETKTRKSIFSLKNIFFLLIIISIAQPLFINFKKQVTEAIHPNTYVGQLKISGMLYDSGYYIKQIHKFLKYDHIKALMLKINCTGGLPGASQALFNELKKFKEKKPIIALVENFSASGGYYVAAAADKIIVSPSATIGSIGTLMHLPNIKKFINYHNIDVNVMTSGKYKASTHPLKDKTPEDIAHLKSYMGEAYAQFIKDMAQARKLDVNKQSEWADGKIFTGNQALKLGLVDQIGSLSDAKQTMRKALESRNVKVEGKIKFVRPKRITGFARLFYGDDADPDTQELSFASMTANFLNTVCEQFMDKQDIKITFK